MMQSGPVVKFDSSTLPAKVNQAHGWRSTGCAADVTQEEAKTTDPALLGQLFSFFKVLGREHWKPCSIVLVLHDVLLNTRNLTVDT